MKKLSHAELLLLRDALRGKRTTKEGFFREFKFEALSRNYRIHWMINVSTFYMGIVGARFTHYEISKTWPNAYKTNLILGTETERTIIIPLEKL